MIEWHTRWHVTDTLEDIQINGHPTHSIHTPQYVLSSFSCFTRTSRGWTASTEEMYDALNVYNNKHVATSKVVKRG